MAGQKGKKTKPKKKDTSQKGLEREVRDGLRRHNQLERERTQTDGFREYGSEDDGDGQK